MLNSNTSALGIIFPNSYDATIPEMVSKRLMASIPFASRYRLIDFLLSSMTNCGINNISLLVNQNYRSLMDHIGSGREWDLVRKNGGLHLFPPKAENTFQTYTGRISALESVLEFLQSQKEKYVVMADSNHAVNFDFKDMIQEHIASGAEISIAYTEEEIPEGYKKLPVEQGFYYNFAVEDGRVIKIYVNTKDPGIKKLSMNIFVVERELLIDLIHTAFVRGQKYLGRDVLMNQLESRNIHAYKCKRYAARIYDRISYFQETMKLLDEENLDALFSPSPVYTKIRDDNPTRYTADANVDNIMAADGCIIEGEVKNSVLFRGVKIGKGAKVENCILMQDTVVEAGAELANMITDKNVTITAGKQVKGTDLYPIYIEKRATV